MKKGSCDHTVEARLTQELAIERAKNEELQRELDNTQRGATRGASSHQTRVTKPSWEINREEFFYGPSIETIEAQERLENQQERLKSARTEKYEWYWWQKEHGFMGRCN